MWVRKRIEVSPMDLAQGLWHCLKPGDRHAISQQIADDWKANDSLVCLSVRSGLDLLLHCSTWQPGSEIIMSGLTIPDMPKIVVENNMVPVGVDIDLATMGPNIDEIVRSITPETKAIVVAHLLGGVCDITKIVEIAREHGLMVIEDCAQAYVGSDYQGDERADVSMFSFGPIKTNTALAGAVFRVRNEQLLERMNRAHDQWKLQSRFRFARRIGKYSFVKFLSTRVMCGSFYRLMKCFGKNHDGVASTMARGFAGPGFFERIRQQPSAPLLRLLHYKLASFDPGQADRRAEKGEKFAQRLDGDVYVLGRSMTRQTYWVLPLLVESPQALVQRLWDAGFDASANCSLHAIFEDEDSVAATLLRHIVFLPLHSRMPEAELERMAEVVRLAGTSIPLLVTRHETHHTDPANVNQTVSGTVESGAGPHFASRSSLVGQVTR